jgi:putative membrane protein
MLIRTLSLLVALLPFSSFAHVVNVPLSSQYSFLSIDPVSALLLLIIAICYFRGSRKISKRVESKQKQYRRQMRWFWSGWLTLVIALISPIDSIGEELFSVHMVQHEMLMMIAAPLLVLSRPEQTILLGGRGFLTPIVHSFTGRSPRMLRFYRQLATPLWGWLIHFFGLWLWHLPFLLNASLTSSWVHSLQHATFLLIAWVFWYSIFRLDKSNSMSAVISLFTTGIHASLLGALLTFSPSIWYSPYAHTTQQWGLSPIEDQQLGGLIMWMPAGIVFILAALVTLARLLRSTNDSDGRIGSTADIDEKEAVETHQSSK